MVLGPLGHLWLLFFCVRHCGLRAVRNYAKISKLCSNSCFLLRAEAKLAAMQLTVAPPARPAPAGVKAKPPPPSHSRQAIEESDENSSDSQAMDVDLSSGDDDLAVVSEGALSGPVTTDSEETQDEPSDGFLDVSDEDTVRDEEQEMQSTTWDWRMGTEDPEEDVQKGKLLYSFFFYHTHFF